MSRSAARSSRSAPGSSPSAGGSSRSAAGRPPAGSAEERLLADLLRVARMVAASFAYLGVLSVLAIGLTLIAPTLDPVARDGPLVLLGLGVAEGGALLAVLLIWRTLDRRPLVMLGFGGPPGLARRRWLRGCGVGALMMGAVVLGWYTFIDAASWSTNPDLGRAALALVVGFVGFLIQGPSEEVLFRGYILENVRRRWGVAWGVAVSAIAFAAMHAFNTSFGVLPFVNLLLFGVATAIYKLRVDGGQLWGVFAIHSMWNWLQQVVFGLPNSGTTSLPDNTLFSPDLNMAVAAPMWGGGFGPEGTLGATLVLLCLIAAVARLRAGTGVLEGDPGHEQHVI